MHEDVARPHIADDDFHLKRRIYVAVHSHVEHDVFVAVNVVHGIAVHAVGKAAPRKKDELFLIRVQDQSVHIVGKNRAVVDRLKPRLRKRIDAEGPYVIRKCPFVYFFDIVRKTQLRKGRMQKRIAPYAPYRVRQDERFARKRHAGHVRRKGTGNFHHFSTVYLRRDHKRLDVALAAIPRQGNFAVRHLFI